MESTLTKANMPVECRTTLRSSMIGGIGLLTVEDDRAARISRGGFDKFASLLQGATAVTNSGTGFAGGDA